MYKLYINKICGAHFYTLFEVPLVGIDNDESAIKQAKILKGSLKDGFVVEIVKTVNASIGYLGM